jgi:uncharacterized membrane protein SpoIIM required for sporulation
MTEETFIRRREGFWREFEGILNGGEAGLRAGAGGFPRSFREVAQDLNTARAHGFDPALIERLNRLVLEGNQLLYGQQDFSLKPLARFLTDSFPRKVRAQWRGLGAAGLIFYGLAFFFGYLCLRFPGMVYEFLPPDQAAGLETMYDPSSPHFLEPRDVSSDADMFGFYIYNNISIAFRTFAGGILCGVGSLFFLAVNGLILGVSAAHLINKGFGPGFFAFIIGHSGLELTAIILSAQAGLSLGYRLFVTRGLSRAASLREAGREALPLVAGAALLLVAAAGIEAFWSSRFTLPLPLRYGAGIGLWVLLILYFLFAGSPRRRRR